MRFYGLLGRLCGRVRPKKGRDTDIQGRTNTGPDPDWPDDKSGDAKRQHLDGDAPRSSVIVFLFAFRLSLCSNDCAPERMKPYNGRACMKN
jgi:hypothetical protein